MRPEQRVNRIFYAFIVVAVLYGGYQQLTWESPSQDDNPTHEVVTTSPGPSLQEEVTALRARVEALEAPPAAPAPKPPIVKVQDAIFDGASSAVDIVIGLVGIMCFFLGLMKVAEKSGLMLVIARLLRPLMVRLFPEVPPDHPAMGAMIMNFAANALGLGNAATPLGLKAIKELDALNPHKGTATDAMVLFLAINTSSITLLPTGVIGIRQVLGSTAPAAILPTTLLATIFSTSMAILAAFTYRRFFPSPAECTPPEDVVELPPPEKDASSVEGYPFWVSATAMLACLALIPLSVVYGDVVSPWFIPLLTVGLLTYGAVSGVRIYEVFVEGAREGWDVAVRIIPFLVAILGAVGMLRASGALDLFIGLLQPLTGPLGLPAEALPMALIRPLSGSGATGVLVSILEHPATGPDTYTGFLVSTLNGSTETTFYVLAVYFGSVGIHRVRHGLVTALTADLFGIIGSVVACQLFFGMMFAG